MLSPQYYYTRVGKASDLKIAKEERLYRFLEILPGIISWSTLLGVIILSWLAPIFAAIFIIVFDVYWFLKTVYLALHLRSAFKKVKENLKINWFDELQRLERNLASKKSVSEIYHLIILPIYKEPYKLAAESFKSLVDSNYPKEKFIVVLATEENTPQETSEKIKKEFEAQFFKFLITTHPKNIDGEIPGKGSNVAWAAKETKKIIIDRLVNDLKLQYENIIVSCFDIDTVVYPDYFARLTYVYLNTENRQNFSYQPVPFYINNIWQAPALARIVAFSATFWHTLQQERIERLTTFSSHSMPFQALIKADFWQTNMVNEDSRIFWQCLLTNDGDYGVMPLYYPVKMDANVSSSFWKTMVSLYKQQRRWAWGCENVPYMLFGFWKNKKMAFRKKWRYSFLYFEGFWSWSTNALIIFLLGWLPLVLGTDEFRQTILSYNLPQTTRWLMTFSMVGLVTSAYLTILILPPKPLQYGKYKYLLMVIQWPLLLLTMIIFGAIPALEAQTRLMLGGKYRLGFWVTPKKR